ncbi:MAG TPA: penicillin acylase family protein [Terriglobales bacterium]|jgi:penicillin amidase|nr:penicillin acylase family protein [Terriglobales bacterium]
MTAQPTVRRRRWLKIAVYALASLLLVCAAIVGGLYHVAHSALPQVDGSLRVAGLTGKVTVKRDARGVPTIEAQNLPDLFFAQGYVTAQDRLWQLDGMRRYATGELSEVLGQEFVKHDREQRILSLRVAAKRSLAVSSNEDRANFHAYSAGINAFIETHRDHLPLEFRILRYAPKPWTDEDCTLIAAQMVKDLNHYHYLEALTREKVLAKIGPELTADLYVNSSAFDRPPTVAPAENPFHRTTGDEDDDEDNNSVKPNLTRAIPSTLEEPRVIGSNNWVVSGAHTVSGKPLLSNDMHLGHQIPNLWYEAHLHAGNFDVAGVTLPGLPYVVVGHNQRVAWGFTNIGPTVEDVYIEKASGDGEYLTPDGWKPPEHRREVIHVKNKPDVVLDVVATRHGPIITELIPEETRKLALRWTLYDGVRSPFFDLNAAQNWDQFRQALSRFDAPGQNVVYGDVDGNIGYQATGKIPIRTGDGILPVDGTTDTAHEWTGFIPFDELPRVYNPPGGVIATANSRIAPTGYKYSVSTGWEAPWRSARIYQVLESGRKFSAADMLGLQTDIYSDFDHFVAERIARAVAHSTKPSGQAKSAAETLRSWDGRMTADSSAAAIEFATRSELMHLLLEPKLGAVPTKWPFGGFNWTAYHRGMQSVWLRNVLEQEPNRWLPPSYSNFDEVVVAALESVVKGKETWNWGDSHPVEIQHPVLGQIPFLRRWTGPGVQPQSGSGLTVKAVSRSHGPSERMTVDLADLDQSTLNLVTGESGNFLSPNYLDQWKAWYEGTTFAFPFSQSAVQKAKMHQLVLEPK